MKLSGTSLIRLSDFIDNLKLVAGTKSITSQEYSNNVGRKVCSYSYINKHYGLSWNSCLLRAGLPINRELSLPIKQGRKLKDKTCYDIECLCCSNMFKSFNIKLNRICNKCKISIEFEDGDL